MRVRVLTIFLSLVFFIGCSSEMNFHTLYIGHLFYDVPEEYAMPYKLSKCKLLIDTYYEPGNLGHGVCNRCGCECDDIDSYVGWCVDCIDCTDTAYLKKMGVSKRSDEMIGTLLPPDCVTGVINVVDEQGIKLLEMSVRRGEMTSLKLWDSGYLLYEAEGAFTSEIPLYDVPIYSFLSGNQKIYNNGQCVIERQSNFIEGCQEFTRFEKMYHNVEDERDRVHLSGYYKMIETSFTKTNDYDYTYEQIGSSYYENEINSRKYTDVNNLEIKPKDLLFIENHEYKLFKSDFVNDGRRWYMAIFYDPNHFYNGAFFSSEREDLTSIYRGHAFDLLFLNSDPTGMTCRMSYICDWNPKDLNAVYDVGINELSEITFSNSDILSKNFAKAQSIVFTPYEIPYDSWLEETLKSHIEQEKDIDSKRRIYPEGNTTYKACPVCGGSGKISQTGMGIILGYTTCPNCGGVGKIVDPKDFFGF